jgi:peptide deformylase
MLVMNILLLGNDVLRLKAEALRDINGQTAQLAREMIEVLRGQGVGLAAPQVGLRTRLFVTLAKDDDARVFINPTIIAASEELGEYEEGCLSIPGVYADVNRPLAVRVQAWNEKGKPFTLDADGLLARVIQHELDHLDGVLFIDHLSALKRKRLIAAYEKKFRA